MSTFGEIVEPVSRTTWEDWDDFYPEDNVTMIQWQLPFNVPEKIESLFILEGKSLAYCINMQSKDHLKLINSSLSASLYLYQIRSFDKYVCTIKDYNLLQSSEIIELLRSLICNSDDVITIQTKPLMDYQTENLNMQSLVIRKVTTSTPSKNSWDFNSIVKLEQPNILSGVGAGAVCLREHINLPATALVYYIEHIEEYQTDEIHKLLEKLNIIQDCSVKFNGILNSNLYI